MRTFFVHVVCVRRHRAHDLHWEITTGAFADFEPPHRRRVLQQITDIANVGQSRRNALDLVPDTTRIQMIGLNLKRHGDRWAAAHPHYMRWLSEQGVSREEAIQRHNEWHAAEMQHPFWKSK